MTVTVEFDVAQHFTVRYHGHPSLCAVTNDLETLTQGPFQVGIASHTPWSADRKLVKCGNRRSDGKADQKNPRYSFVPSAVDCPSCREEVAGMKPPHFTAAGRT